ncbi:hypothetical protein [Halorubrum distributum]|uniref:Uncharacterized protein n=1 Tax=Halorubrum distributum JCM 10247 TaxID=1227486 RepID=M0DEA7_9EURY|nr:hypothetical protein [Halorubrum terrestre]ELZ33810.1 hypothetical protein C473_07020 [Halorubrum terrestre JCM 10247]
MSTRCQLRFVRTLEQGRTADPTEPVAQVYTHSDGYPEGVVGRLHQLKQLLEATRSVRGPAYAAAQYLFLEKLTSLPLYLDPNREPSRRLDAASPADVCDPSRMQHLSQPLFLLGHGVEDPRAGIHGDEEYLYMVSIPEYSIEQSEPPTWEVAVSDPCGFPRWDAQTDAAFSEATWQFEGSLTDACGQFIEKE